MLPPTHAVLSLTPLDDDLPPPTQVMRLMTSHVDLPGLLRELPRVAMCFRPSLNHTLPPQRCVCPTGRRTQIQSASTGKMFAVHVYVAFLLSATLAARFDPAGSTPYTIQRSPADRQFLSLDIRR